jgi:hypothetical protein
MNVNPVVSANALRGGLILHPNAVNVDTMNTVILSSTPERRTIISLRYSNTCTMLSVQRKHKHMTAEDRA